MEVNIVIIFSAFILIIAIISGLYFYKKIDLPIMSGALSNSDNKCDCGFCEKYLVMREGENNEKLKIENEKFLVVFDNKEKCYFDIFYCPFCEKKT